MLQDLRYALRQLRNSPGFAITAILTLSLGIGASSAIFNVIDAVMLRPLPFPDQDRLVSPVMLGRTGDTMRSSYPSYLDVRAQQRTFGALAGYSMFGRVNLEGPSGPVALRAVKSTDNFFDVFGVKPLLGRTYLPGEDQPGKDNLVVLSYEVWKSSFAGDTDVVGKDVQLDGTPCEPCSDKTGSSEFLRRFLLHLLPRGFVRIRHFGFVANRRRASLLPICFQLLNLAREQAPPAKEVSPTQQDSTWRCPLCGGPMRIVERISAAQLLLGQANISKWSFR